MKSHHHLQGTIHQLISKALKMFKRPPEPYFKFPLRENWKQVFREL